MELDRTDVEILRALQDDARLSYRDLSRRVGVSVPTISARVANLEQLGILRGYHAWVDVERLRQAPVVIVLRCRAAAADSVGKALAAMPEIRWTVRAEGARVLAEAVLRAAESVEAFLGRVRRLDGVLGLESYRAVKGFKDAPRAVIAPGLTATLRCFECGKAIEGEPVKLKLDGRNHYLCCRSCEKLYAERYSKIRAAAKRIPKR